MLQLTRHSRVESGSFDRVGDRRQESIRVRLLQMIDRGLDVIDSLTDVTEHDEDSRLDAKSPRRCSH